VLLELLLETMPSLNFCFTAFTKPKIDESKFHFVIYQEEICPETKKHHWQGYLELKTQAKYKAIQKALGDETAHLEKRAGSQEDAIHYCTKPHKDCTCAHCVKEVATPTAVPNTVVRIGTPKPNKQGSRSDLMFIKDEIAAGATLFDIADEHFGSFVKYNKGIEKYINMRKYHKQALWTPLKVLVVRGATGVGKTRSVMELFGKDVFMLQEPQKSGVVWFDFYDGQKTLLIDEFEGWITQPMLLRLLDGYPMQLQTKGGHTLKEWTRVVITCNKPLVDWYPKWKGLNAVPPEVKRRIGQVIEVTKDTTLESLRTEVAKFFEVPNITPEEADGVPWMSPDELMIKDLPSEDNVSDCPSSEPETMESIQDEWRRNNTIPGTGRVATDQPVFEDGVDEDGNVMEE